MFKLKKSKLFGEGIFTNVNLKKDERIGIWITKNTECASRRLPQTDWFETSDFGRFCNHSGIPNTYFRLESDFMEVVLYSNGIKKDEEILVNYMDAQKITGFKVNLSFINDK